MQNNKDRVSCKITKIACQAIHQVLLQGVRKIKSNSFYLPYFLFSVPFIYCFLFFSFYLVQMLALLLCRFFGRNYFRRNKNLFIFLSKTITIHKLQNPLHLSLTQHVKNTLGSILRYRTYIIFCTISEKKKRHRNDKVSAFSQTIKNEKFEGCTIPRH